MHLHWIASNMVKIKDLAKIKNRLFGVFTIIGLLLVDVILCGSVNDIKSNAVDVFVLNSEKENDLSRKIYNLKQKTFSKIPNLTIIGLSSWLNNCSKKSSLLKDRRHLNLPNPIRY